MACCPKDSLGFLEEDPCYVLKGKLVSYDVPQKNYKLSAYIVGDGTRGILVGSDIFGIHSGLHKRVCDELSILLPGYVIIMPDYFVNGTYVTGDNTSIFFYPRLVWAYLSGSLHQYRWEDSMKPHFDATVDYLIDQYHVTKIGLCGFCWGTYLNARACSESKHSNIIVGSVAAHPSVAMLASIFGEKQEEIVEKFTCPHLLLPTIQEPSEWKPGGWVEAKLKAKSFPVPSEVIYYEQAHGFVTRGDLKDPAVAPDMRDAVRRTSQFFHQCFPAETPSTKTNM